MHLCLAELGFNAFFTLELLLRAGASSGPRAYLSNAWNIFDLLMVLAGYTEFLPASWFGTLSPPPPPALLGDTVLQSRLHVANPLCALICM